MRRFAYAEANSHLTSAIGLLNALADGPERKQLELRVQSSLGAMLLARDGPSSSDARAALTRTQELSAELGDDERQFVSVIGLRLVSVARLDAKTTAALELEIVALAERIGRSSFLSAANAIVGHDQLWRGEFAAARASLEKTLTLAEDNPGDVGLFPGYLPAVARGFLALAVLKLGYPDQARECAHAAVARAREHGQPLTLAMSLLQSGALYLFLGDRVALAGWAAEAARIAHEHGYSFLAAIGAAEHGAAMVLGGELTEGVRTIREAVDHAGAQGMFVAALHGPILVDALTRLGNLPRRAD